MKELCYKFEIMMILIKIKIYFVVKIGVWLISVLLYFIVK